MESKGQGSRGDKCSFRHDEDKRAKPTPKTAPSSDPPTHRGRSASLEEQKALKEDRFLRGRQIAFMIYDYFRVTGAHDRE